MGEKEKEKKRRRNITFKLGNVTEICVKQNGEGGMEGKAGSVRAGILIAFFTWSLGT